MIVAGPTAGWRAISTGTPSRSLHARGAGALGDDFRMAGLGDITSFPAPAARGPSPRPLLIGGRFTRPRFGAKLRSPDRLALREELLVEVRQRVHRRPAHQVVADAVFALFARTPKRACFGTNSVNHGDDVFRMSGSIGTAWNTVTPAPGPQPPRTNVAHELFVRSICGILS